MRWLLCSALVALASGASAKDAYVSMIYSNAIDETSPFELIRSGSWKAAPDARYVKLHVYFDEPIPIWGVEVETCIERLDHQISVWVNFDEWAARRRSESEADADPMPYPGEIGFADKTFYARHFELGTEARSLTFNFEGWRGVSLCGFRVFDPEKRAYALHAPVVVAGSARASSTLEPTAAYDVMNLFDSRFEYAWASAGRAKDVDLVFQFAEPQRIERLRLWNGYQRSSAHCIANSRAKRLRVTGSNGYSADVAIADQLGSQVVALSKPFAGREMRIRVVDAYPGKAYQDLVLSELRFWNGRDWVALDSVPMIRAAAAANRAQFAASGLPGVLNQSFTDDSQQGGFTAQEATLRLRADGSFYLSGAGSHTEEEKRYFSLGNFEITRADASGVRLRLFGLYYETEAYGDCNGCGRDCNRRDDPSLGRIFEEHVAVKVEKRTGDELLLRVDNESGGKKLPFKTLHLRPEKEVW